MYEKPLSMTESVWLHYAERRTMAEPTQTRARKPRSSAKPAAAAAPETTTQRPIIEEHTVQAALAWLNIVDDWTLGGYQNKLPRWVYVLVGFLILT